MGALQSLRKVVSGFRPNPPKETTTDRVESIGTSPFDICSSNELNARVKMARLLGAM